jgi:hypothetical protein
MANGRLDTGATGAAGPAFPSQARVVVIGGGIVGCSVAFHLTRRGWRDVVLLLLYHNEPIWRDGALVGRVSSGMFGHTVGRAIGLGYVRREDGPVTAEWLADGRYEIEVANERFPARASLRAPYDPANERVRA